MIAIKGMEMPKCCATCHISEVVCRYKKTAFVRYSRGDFSIPSDCPLVEIVTCKDCTHYGCAKAHSPNHWCSDGERRE